MKENKSLVRPIIIGVAGASKSGKTILRKQLANLLKEYEITNIYLDYYHKEIAEEDKTEFNQKDAPGSYDFDRLIQDIEKLRSGTSVQVVDRDNLPVTLLPHPVLLVDGILTFYDKRLRNLFDLKIFIDVDLDMCLINKIHRDLALKPGIEFSKIIEEYQNHLRPIYVKYLAPSKKYADVILPQIEENSAFISILVEYLKMELKKLMNLDMHAIFTSPNELIDPKYQFFDKNILVTTDQSNVNFIKQVFEDVVTKEENEELVSKTQDKLMQILTENLYNFFKQKTTFKGEFPKVNMIITENDDLESFDWPYYRSIIFFKPFIMSDEDAKILENICRRNKKMNVVICSIFLAPKFADQLLSNKVDTLLLNTIYFSDFLTKFEVIVKENSKVFEIKSLYEKFNLIKNEFGEDN